MASRRRMCTCHIRSNWIRLTISVNFLVDVFTEDAGMKYSVYLAPFCLPFYCIHSHFYRMPTVGLSIFLCDLESIHISRIKLWIRRIFEHFFRIFIFQFSLGYIPIFAFCTYSKLKKDRIFSTFEIDLLHLSIGYLFKSMMNGKKLILLFVWNCFNRLKLEFQTACVAESNSTWVRISIWAFVFGKCSIKYSQRKMWNSESAKKTHEKAEWCKCLGTLSNWACFLIESK